MYIQFSGEDMSIVTAMTQAREQANEWLRANDTRDILSEQVVTLLTVGQKNIVIILLRVSV